jgi:hypothetical protein
VRVVAPEWFVNPNEPDEDIVWIGGSVERVSLKLSVWGEDLNPEDITSLLRCSPNDSWRKGDPWKYGPGYRPFGMWSIGVDSVSGTEAEIRLHQLLDRTTPDPEAWLSIRARFDARIFVGVFMEAGNRGLGLSSLMVKRLAERGLRIDFDIYHLSGQDESDTIV